MLKLLASVLSARTNHPLLVTLFILASVFGAAGYAIDSFTTHQVIAAFCIVYAILWAGMGMIGYAALFSGKFVRRFYRETGVSS
jgi:hypothetical protein